MASTMDLLIEVGQTTKVVYLQKREYEYPFEQVTLLLEIAQLFNLLSKQKTLFSFDTFTYQQTYQRGAEERYNDVQRFLFGLLKTDPLGSYVEIKRLIRTEKIKLE